MTITTMLTPTGTHAVGGRVRSVAGAPVPAVHSTPLHSMTVRPTTTVDLPLTAWPPGSAT